MSSFLTRPTVPAAHDENTARFAAKPVIGATDASRPGIRRPVLGDISNTAALATAAAAAKPAVKPATISAVVAPMVAAAAPVPEARPLAAAPAHFSADMDVDSADADDPTAVSDYVNEIYQNFQRVEVAKTARYGYLAAQNDINEKMRSILIDWLVEVHQKFKLVPETMYLAVNIIDRFLERKLVPRQKLQLVGVTAMLLASKYEEIYPPEVRDFVYITDKAYSKEQILQMEAMTLNTLEFRVTVPTTFVFLNRYLKVAGVDTATDMGTKTALLATYLAERTLQEYRFLQYPPSKIAASMVNVALRSMRGRGAWDHKLEAHSGYRQDELRPCVLDMEEVLRNQATHNLKAVHKKYSNPKYHEVANIPVAPIDA